jgi:hypothetical protein
MRLEQILTYFDSTSHYSDLSSINLKLEKIGEVKIEADDKNESSNNVDICVSIKITVANPNGGNTHDEIGFGHGTNPDRKVAIQLATDMAVEDGVKRASSYFFSMTN